jgi:hypothetical protein
MTGSARQTAFGLTGRETGGRRYRRTLTLIGGLIAAACWGTAAAAITMTATPKPATSTPTETPTGTITVTPTSCGADPPIVEPVTSPEIFLQQVIVASGHVTGARFMIFSSPLGCTMPTHTGTAYEAQCDLLPNQVNEIEVCIVNPLCGAPACTRMDRNGQALDILTSDETPTVTVTPTPTPTRTPKPCAPDCNGDHNVTVEEILHCAGIALQLSDVPACAACDVDGNGKVDVADLIAGVNAAVVGC